MKWDLVEECKIHPTVCYSLSVTGSVEAWGHFQCFLLYVMCTSSFGMFLLTKMLTLAGVVRRMAVDQMLVSLMILALNMSENSIICIKLLFFGLFLAFEKSPKLLANSCNSHSPKSFSLALTLHSCRLPAVAAGRQRPTVTFDLASCSETPDSPALAPQRKMLYPLTLLIYFSFICKMKNTYLSSKIIETIIINFFNIIYQNQRAVFRLFFVMSLNLLY